MNTKLLKIATCAAYFVMVGMNFLAVTLPLGGRDTGTISESYPNLFAPASFAFSIWGVIYTLLGLFVIYRLLCKKNNLVEKVSRIFIVNALLNGAWIVAWHYDYIWLTVLIMIGLLLTLIRIADILRVSTLSENERWFIRLPFSVYFGWITVATIANITVFFVWIRWGGFGLPESLWTVIILLVGALIGSWRILQDRAIPYGLVLLWAYGAIYAKHTSASGFAGQYPSVIMTAIVCLCIFAGTLLFIRFNKKP